MRKMRNNFYLLKKKRDFIYKTSHAYIFNFYIFSCLHLGSFLSIFRLLLFILCLGSLCLLFIICLVVLVVLWRVFRLYKNFGSIGAFFDFISTIWADFSKLVVFLLNLFNYDFEELNSWVSDLFSSHVFLGGDFEDNNSDVECKDKGVINNNIYFQGGDSEDNSQSSAQDEKGKKRAMSNSSNDEEIPPAKRPDWKPIPSPYGDWKPGSDWKPTPSPYQIEEQVELSTNITPPVFSSGWEPRRSPYPVEFKEVWRPTPSPYPIEEQDWKPTPITYPIQDQAGSLTNVNSQKEFSTNVSGQQELSTNVGPQIVSSTDTHLGLSEQNLQESKNSSQQNAQNVQDSEHIKSGSNLKP